MLYARSNQNHQPISAELNEGMNKNIVAYVALDDIPFQFPTKVY